MAKKHDNNQQITNYTYTETKKYINPQQHLSNELAIDENIKIIDSEVYNDIMYELKKNHDTIQTLIDRNYFSQNRANESLFWNSFWAFIGIVAGVSITAGLFIMYLMQKGI